MKSQDARVQRLKSLPTDPWFGRIWVKFSDLEKATISDFVKENQNLSKSDFELKINRLYLDGPKPKNWKQIHEALSICNTSVDANKTIP